MPRMIKQKVKKLTVTANVAGLKPADKPAHAHGVKDTCQSSAAFNASSSCQTALTTWISAADALGANQQAKTVAQNTLLLIEQQEAHLVVDYDNGADGFALAVQSTAKNDPSIVAGMGMGVHAEPTPPPDATVPMGARVVVVKRTAAKRFTWNAVPGARMYTAQMSPLPVTDASWVTLYGNGKSRALPPLVPGQQYALRVCAIGHDGKPTGWSVTLTITG